MDVFPQARGHTLVISKETKARKSVEVEPNKLCLICSSDVQRVARAVCAALRPDGVAISQFNGASAGQSVFHLHFHIIPRWAGRPAGPTAKAAWPTPPNWRSSPDRSRQ